MAKLSDHERAKRLNAAVALLEGHCIAEGATILAQQYGISKRQAYRYLREAVNVGKPIPIPEHKAAFTIKLPEVQIAQLRGYATNTQQSLSDIVSQAISAYLKKRGHV